MEIKGKRGPALLLGLLVVILGMLLAGLDSDAAVRGWIERSSPEDQEQPGEPDAPDQSGNPGTGEPELIQRPDVAGDATGQFATDNVARPTFTTDVADREPVDELYHLPLDATEVYFFTELRNMEGQTAVHRWEYAGNVQAEVAFDVGGPRWRVWSVKSLQPQWDGTWTVSVVSGTGEVLARSSIEYSDSPSAGQPAGQ